MKKHIIWLIGLMVLLSIAAIAQTISKPQETKNIFDFLISTIQVLGPLGGLWLTYILKKDVKVMSENVDGKVTQLIATTEKLAEAKTAIAKTEGIELGKEAHKEEVKIIKEEIRQETKVIKEEIKDEGKTDNGKIK